MPESIKGMPAERASWKHGSSGPSPDTVYPYLGVDESPAPDVVPPTARHAQTVAIAAQGSAGRRLAMAKCHVASDGLLYAAGERVPVDAKTYADLLFADAIAAEAWDNLAPVLDAPSDPLPASEEADPASSEAASP